VHELGRLKLIQSPVSNTKGGEHGDMSPMYEEQKVRKLTPNDVNLDSKGGSMKMNARQLRQ
jgi:hypothetical protein